MTLLHRFVIWVKRFRHRCGYGVHSPSDFFIITSVIYEKTPYYAYHELKKKKFNKNLHHYREKVNKLLFRMCNYMQSPSLLEIGNENGASIEYMTNGNKKMSVFSISDDNWLTIEKTLIDYVKENKVLSLLHIGNTIFYKEIMQLALENVDINSWIIVGGIHDSKEKKRWWTEVIEDNRVVISFDLYDIGFLFFKKKRYKQNYIVNFL